MYTYIYKIVYFGFPPVDEIYSRKANVNFLEKVTSHPLDIIFSNEGEIAFLLTKLLTSFICVKHMH